MHIYLVAQDEKGVLTHAAEVFPMFGTADQTGRNDLSKAVEVLGSTGDWEYTEVAPSGLPLVGTTAPVAPMEDGRLRFTASLKEGPYPVHGRPDALHVDMSRISGARVVDSEGLDVPLEQDGIRLTAGNYYVVRSYIRETRTAVVSAFAIVHGHSGLEYRERPGLAAEFRQGEDADEVIRSLNLRTYPPRLALNLVMFTRGVISEP